MGVDLIFLLYPWSQGKARVILQHMSERLTIRECLDQKKSIIFDTDLLIDFWNEEKAGATSQLQLVRHQYRYMSVINAVQFLTDKGKLERPDRIDWIKKREVKKIHISARASELFWNYILHRQFQGGIPDGLIAATAHSAGFALATRNIRHFDPIKGLVLVSDFVKEDERERR